MGKYSRQKINMAIMILHNTVDIYRIFNSKTAEITFILKCTWNVVQDRSLTRPQNKFEQIKDNRNYFKQF